MTLGDLLNARGVNLTQRFIENLPLRKAHVFAVVTCHPNVFSKYYNLIFTYNPSNILARSLAIGLNALRD